MSQVKDNLRILCGVTAALVLVAGAGRYLYSRWELNNRNLDQLKQSYAKIKILNERNPESVKERMAVADVETLNITFRAVGRDRISPVANQEVAFDVLNEMSKSAYFDASKTRAVGDITPEIPLNEQGVYTASGEPPGTFSFKIVAKLKRPLKL
jgi:hypothetical protein